MSVFDIVWFDADNSTDLSLVGGKGANLGRLTQAGFVVPGGYVVGTDGYLSHIASNEGLKGEIADILSTVDYDDAEALDAAVAKIRHHIVETPIPHQVSAAITAAYGKLGKGAFVAVRSSGTAEDLEGNSFAGLHDTYLDICGNDNVLDAVKRCWASMWTSRAVFYRHSQGFSHFDSAIAVVVQKMVESEVAGVLFTGNPINTANDQLVINASWGLGEAVVSGIVTPDEFIVSSRGYKVLNRTLGTKEHRIIRDAKAGSGTLHLSVDEADRARFCLTDAEVAKLAAVGRDIEDYYGGLPQDIEWGYENGQFYILQARPITGVDFSWDCDVTASVQGNDDAVPYDNIWSRSFPEEMWTGAISPLMFSWRCWGLNQCHSLGVHAFGYPEMDHSAHRLWIYHKGVSYYNTKADLQLLKTAVPPQLRAGMLHKVPKAWHEEIMSAEFDWERYLDSFLKVEKHRPDMGLNWWRAIRDDFIENAEYREATRVRSREQLQAISDDDLRRHIHDVMRLEISSYDPPWNGLLYYMRDALGWIGWIIENWYTGGRSNVFMSLVTGTREPTITNEENYAVWALADMIYRSPELKALFEKYPDERFMTFVDQCREGPAFRAAYEEHVEKRGHRGHPDRDIYFARRADDIMVDFRLFQGLMGTTDPRIQEETMREKLEEMIAHVYENLRGQDMGVFKAKLFDFLIEFAHKSIKYRDDEREVMDWSTYAIKCGFAEIGRRCVEAGRLKEDRDFYFLTMDELYAVLDGRANMALTQAKITARKRNFDKINTKAVHPAPYLQFGRAAPIDEPELSGDGVLKGKITSVGKVTGTARVVYELSQIGRVQKGDILIVHATDPGWTPVFMLIKGIVLETGGLISHGALLAREYGLPGVQIEGALRLIPDGATITVDGDVGAVVIHSDDEVASDEPVQQVA